MEAIDLLRLDVLRLLVDAHNRWYDESLDQLRAEHAELRAAVLPRLPPVLPSGLPPLDAREALDGPWSEQVGTRASFLAGQIATGEWMAGS